MRDPVSWEASGDGVPGAVREAAERLHQAVARLEANLAERPPPFEATAQAEPAQGERDRLSAELKAAQDRERALEAAAAAASEALGRAAAEVRAALQDIELDDPDDPGKGAEAKIMGEEEAA